MSQGFSRKPRTMAKRDGAWDDTAVSSDTLGGGATHRVAVPGYGPGFTTKGCPG